MNNLFKIILLLGIVIFTACRANRLVQNNTSTHIKLKKHSSEYLLKKMAENTIEADWLSAKAKILYKSPSETRRFTANIRMRKDSIIWMNIKKVNIEVARILVDTDSVYIINRLDKEYYVKGLDFVEEKFNLPARFTALQTALLGNPWFFENQKLESSVKESQYLLSSGQETRMLSDYFLNGMAYSLEQMFFLDLERDRKLKVFLEKYKPLTNQIKFAHSRNFQIGSEEIGEVEVKIDFSKVEIDVPKTIPFGISSRYKRVD